MVATMHKNRLVRMIHFGLTMRESDPVKLIAMAVTQSGDLISKICLKMDDGETVMAIHMHS